MSGVEDLPIHKTHYVMIVAYLSDSELALPNSSSLQLGGTFVVLKGKCNP